MQRRFFTDQTALDLRFALRVWWPSMLVMIALFMASAQPKHIPSTGEPAEVYFSGWIPIFPGLLDFLIKKGAHVLVYGVLALLNLRALLLSAAQSPEAICLAFVLTAGYAVLDELHQAFVPGRHASVLDIGFDCLGAVLFIYACNRLTRRLSR